MVSKKEDAPVLKNAGMMGHTFTVLAFVDGERRIVGECDTIEEARKLRADHMEGFASIYFREGKKWTLTV